MAGFVTKANLAKAGDAKLPAYGLLTMAAGLLEKPCSPGSLKVKNA